MGTFIYIVRGTIGRHEDFRQWLVKAYTDSAKAEDHATKARAKALELAQMMVIRDDLTYQDRYTLFHTNLLDPDMQTDGAEVCDYDVIPLELD